MPALESVPTTTFVRLNAVTHLVGGVALLVPPLTTPAALVLAASLVPTSIAGFPFWTMDGPQRMHAKNDFTKNVGLMAGLVAIAAGTARRQRSALMIKPWLFEFFHSVHDPAGHDDPETVHEHYRRYFDLWVGDEGRGFEGIFFSEHHFGPGYSPSPNLLISHLAARHEHDAPRRPRQRVGVQRRRGEWPRSSPCSTTSRMGGSRWASSAASRPSSRSPASPSRGRGAACRSARRPAGGGRASRSSRTAARTSPSMSCA